MSYRLSLRGQSAWVTAWLLWAHLCGLAAISIIISYALLEAFVTVGPVVEPLVPPYSDPNKIGELITINPRVITPRVLPGGRLTFRVDFQRNEACAGVVTETYKSSDERSVIVQQRRTLSTKVQKYFDVEVTTQLPPAVYPGVWHYVQTVESDGCPGGRRDKPDFFTEFDFEVLPDVPR